MAVGTTRPRPAPAGPGARERRPARRRRTAAWHFLTFAAPGTLVYVCLVLLPIALSVGYSLTNQALLRPHTEFVGLRNYWLLLQDETFLQSLRVTAILSLIVVIVPNVLGVAIAVLLDRRGRIYNALRTVFFTPMVISSVVISVIWTRILADDGPVNQALRALGTREPPGWLSDPDLALYSLASIVCWQMLGFCVVVYLAGLQGVPQELLEAAAIDGAGAARRFRHVTWPLLAPALTVNTVVLLISAFKIFDQVKVVTNGGPGTGTTASVAFVVLQEGFVENRTGYASAEAVVMLIVVAGLSVVTLRFLQRREVQV
ncbi:carbohydrate ABC transporter permease [Nonomuraea roseoviolacea]|uniref:Multiple sugar transport system permease protein n=1 Tax=Nonomuraea roseoviolacea subsp. carminata TaxID=160689 RepID=A0ABT1JRI3_9ACTN|nr:sugar ABC transporter permease [Nonomuraea roseoviolacea]MCP2343957.1 multiple sugar transport system permease protein [Nonomuraea roseoviolacea subsp. carminata]